MSIILAINYIVGFAFLISWGAMLIRLNYGKDKVFDNVRDNDN